ncbi:hypothetical protein F4802DRAFT_58834 [Xylaria palmicola]|nr:hypothetical protein F4802DRAFT_58834 [Xylaria palmicola]
MSSQPTVLGNAGIPGYLFQGCTAHLFALFFLSLPISSNPWKRVPNRHGCAAHTISESTPVLASVSIPRCMLALRARLNFTPEFSLFWRDRLCLTDKFAGIVSNRDIRTQRRSELFSSYSIRTPHLDGWSRVQHTQLRYLNRSFAVTLSVTTRAVPRYSTVPRRLHQACEYTASTCAY